MRRSVHPADFELYRMFSEPCFSADGRRIAFSVKRANLADDEYGSEVYVSDTRGGDVSRFTSGGKDSDPVWSPDGSSILFLSKRGFAKDEKGSALYVIPAEGGEARLLVKRKEGVENPQWSPDSSAIFYLSDVVKEEKGDVKVIKRFGYWFNGKGFTYNRRKHLFKIDVKMSKSDRITSGAFDVTDFAVSHGGKAVAYLAITDDLKPYISDLVVCNLQSGRKVRITRSNMEISTLSWSPDDSRIAILGDDLPSGFASHEVIWVADLASRRMSRPDTVDRNKANGLNSDVRAKAHGPHRVAWEKDGIYFLQADGGSVGLYRLKPGSKPTQIVKGDRSIEGFDVRDGKVAFVAMDAEHLEELYVKAGREVQLTTMNASAEKALDIRPSEAFSFKASDGQTVEGWLLLPRRKGKVPAILYVHGGPKTSFGHSFMHEFQVFGGAGYAVVYMNPRGSDGYSERFADIRGIYGTRDYDDLMEGLDYVLKRYPQIDGKRLGIAGGSYGGYMTNWAVGHTDRFRAAVTDRSIASWISMWGVSDIGPHFTSDQMGGDPGTPRRSSSQTRR